MAFLKGIEKTAVSVAWALRRINGGIKSRRPGLSDSKKRLIDHLTKPRLLDHKLKADPKDNLPVLRQLSNGVKKNNGGTVVSSDITGILSNDEYADLAGYMSHS